ncbi:hypothetical protein SAMN06265360_102203 [Haloechinothrix alba]|uniref:DUF6801 domain-containing protein n=1 Tax=Haloechinothrix alba TaxID=664784 RepID=A0A238VGI1_9PSEU|nr:DUF6801 domain-containing protein [Haloechinothrix alba]SNR33177.1 hypothetical protein SAMN06265360_102203 [Haloechinothrix alba]
MKLPRSRKVPARAVSAAFATALAVGSAALVAGAATAGDVSFESGTRCSAGSGAGFDAVLGFTGALPDTVAEGQDVELPPVEAAVTLPSAAVDALRGSGVEQVDIALDASLRLGQGERTTELPVEGMVSDAVSLPGSGELDVALSGSVPEYTPADTGPVRVELVELVAGGTAYPSGSAKPRPIECAGTGHGEELGTITVAGSAESPGESTDDGGDPAESDDSGVTMAEPAAPGIELDVSFDVDAVSHIAGLGSDLELEQGRFDGVIYEEDGENKVRGDLDIPPSAGYFVAFDFMPTTSTVELVQHGEVSGDAELDLAEQQAHVDLDAELFVLLSDVRQDGVSLGVGDECRTRVPASIEITGTVNLAEGAESRMDRSEYTIPTFTGCGMHEPLDPLMTGLVSGGGNLLDTTLTTRCIATCPERE